MRGGFSVTSASGGLVSGYHPAARLRDCELTRVINEEDGSYRSHFSGTIVWKNHFWITQPVILLMHFQTVQWRWDSFTMQPGAYAVGDRISGVALGDPDIVRGGA